LNLLRKNTFVDSSLAVSSKRAPLTMTKIGTQTKQDE
jgi:hypothetical protein